MREQDVSGSERRVAAEIDLDGRREPAQPVPLAFRREERGLGKIVLRSDRLHDVIGRPFGQRHNGRRIALEDAIRKGIDLIENRFHHPSSLLAVDCIGTM